MSRRSLGSIREIRPGVFRVEVALGVHPVTGKRHRPGVTIHGDERDAETALARLLLNSGQIPEAEVTLSQYLLEMYLPHVEGKVRARTADGYRSKLETHVIPVLGSVPLATLSPWQLDRWLAGVKGSPRTKLHAYRVLSSALNQAVLWRLIEHSPLRAVSPPQVRQQRPDVLTPKEASAYLEAFSGHLLEPIVVLALAAGLRRSELAGLTWKDVDLTGGTVVVRRGLHDFHGEVLEELPKSATSARTVALPDWAIAILRPLRGLGAIVTEDGAPIRPWRISSLYEARVASAQLRRIPLRNLRHTHACLLLDAGVDLYTVSRRLGHSTVAVTEAHYIRPSEDADRAAANALDIARQDAASGSARHNDARP